MPASIFSETELARLASFPEEIPGDDLIRAFTLTGADRDLPAGTGTSSPSGGGQQSAWGSRFSFVHLGSRENVLSRALRDLGRLVKTQFILRWIENPDYRRRIHRQLNKGEALHALRRFLFFAHQGKVQRRQADQQTNQVLCLNLVTNAIVTWNTVYMERRHRTAAGRGEDRSRHRSRPSVACPLRARQSLR